MFLTLHRATVGAVAGLLSAVLAGSPVQAQSLSNASFETPVVPANTDSLRPASATWTFFGQAGIRNNNAPNGGDGKQAAFLSVAPVSGNNNFGSVRQTVTLKPGTYFVRYLGAVKTPTGRPQPLQFYVNSVTLGGVLNPRYLTDATTGGFESGWTQPFVVTTAGSYEIRFDATNATNYGTTAAPLYAVAYLDALTVFSVPGAFANAGFESTGSWTLSSGATLTTATDAPEGAKVLSLAASATASQTVSLPAGQYSISLKLGKASLASGTLNLEIASNGGAVVTVATTSATTASEYRTYTTPAFTLPSGNHVVTLRGSGSAFSMDTIALNDAAPDALNSGFETPTLAAPSSATASGPTAANPANANWIFTGTGGMIQANAGTSNTSAPRTLAAKQYLALSGTGAVAQSLALAGGTYVAVGQVAQGGLNVLIDGAAVGKLAASTLDFREVMSLPFVVAAGTRSLGLTADSSYSPSTPKLDEIRLLRVDLPPAVSITAPANGAVFQTGATVSITAAASDPDGISALTISRTPSTGSIAQLATSTSSPLSTSWSNSSANGYTITASATDSTGATSSTAISIRVNANPSAVVSVSPIGPVVNSATAVTATVTVSSASDSDGAVTKIEFLQDAVVASTCTKTIPPAVAPFTCALSLPPRAAAYSLTVRVTDNDAGVTTTTPLTLRINTAPTVTLVAACVAPCSAPGTVNLTATPTDSDGTIGKVEFYDGATLLWTKSAAPWTYSHATATTGSHSYTAKAFDNDNSSTSSSVQTVTVTTPVASVALTASCTAPCNAPAAVTLTAVPSNITGTISKVEFYDGATLLNSDTTSPYSFVVASVAAATHSYAAKVYVTGTTAAVATSTAQAVRVNALPTVTLTATCVAPCNAPGTVNLIATPADSDGTIGKVEFYDGATLLTTKSVAPWTYGHTAVASGSHSYTAKAFDDSNASATSTAQTVTVAATAASIALTANCTAPCNAPAAVALTAVPANVVGTVSKVEFYDGTTLLGSDTTSPYSFAVTSVAAANHSYSAKVYVTGTTPAAATSAAQAVRVNALPTVTLTAVCVAPCAVLATVNLTANPTDSDGTISKVEFYDGSTLRGTATAAPWSFSDTNAGVGSHNYTAKAFDNDLASRTSFVVAVTVASTPPPSVLLTAACDAPCEAPASFTLTATPTNIPGGASYVDFYEGTTYLWPKVSVGDGTYSYRWINVGVGAHTVKVVVGSQAGAAETISTLNVNVATPANWRPTVDWVSPIYVSPTYNVTTNAFGSFVLCVAANDQDGTIVSVKFYVDGSLLGVGTPQGATYCYTWTNLPSPGPFQVTAVAIDNLGATTTSLPMQLGISSTVQFPPLSQTVFYTDASGTGTINIPLVMTPTPQDFQGPSWQWNGNTHFSPWTVELLENNVVVDSQKYGFEKVPSPSWNCTYYLVPNLDHTCIVVWPAPNFARLGKAIGTYRYAVRLPISPGVIWQSAETQVAVAEGRPILTASGAAPGDPIYQGFVLLTAAAPAFTAGGGITFYEGTQYLGRCTLLAGTCAFNWRGASAGSHTVTATVTAPLGGTATSAPVTFNVVANALPTVTVVAPADLTGFRSPATVTVKVAAADSDGTVTAVEFYDDYLQPLGAGTFDGATYNLTLPEIAAPTRNRWVLVRVRATDNRGAVSGDAVAQFVVYTAPVVTFESPCTNSSCYAGGVSLGFSSTMDTAYITRARYLRNGVECALGTLPNFEALDRSGIAGTHEYRVEITTTFGHTAISMPVSVAVLPNALPTVTLLSPSNGANAYNATAIVLRATASDSDGSITQVDFYRDGNVMIGTGSFSSGVYTLNWTGVASGNYLITAQATDNRGAVGVSATASVTLANGPQPLAISYPVNGSEFPAGQTITVSTVGANADPAIVTTELWRVGVSGAADVLLTSISGTGVSYLLTLPATTQAVSLYSVAINGVGARTRSRITTVWARADISDPRFFVWSNLNAALLSGNKVAALEFVRSDVRPTFDAVFTALMPRISSIVASYLSSPLLFREYGDVAEYMMIRSVEADNEVYLIRFVRNAEGLWQIESM